MNNSLKNFRIIHLTLLFCFVGTVGWGQNVNLKVVGDSEEGFAVDIYSGNQLLIHNNEEFSLQMFNLDMSTVADIQQWRGSEWIDNEQSITLIRKSFIKEFDANLSVTVTYEVINSNVIKKTVELFQPSMPGMHYILSETVRPADKPVRYVTFEYNNFPGGFVHEIYPTAGFVTPDNKVVGLLTDASYKNQFTRNTRRRVLRGGGFVGIRKLADVNLFSIASLSERDRNNHYIKQTFGEMYNLDTGVETTLKNNTVFQKEGNAEVKNRKRTYFDNRTSWRQSRGRIYFAIQRSKSLHYFIFM